MPPPDNKSCNVRCQRTGTQEGATDCGHHSLYWNQDGHPSPQVSGLHAEGTAPPSDPTGSLLPTVHCSPPPHNPEKSSVPEHTHV